MSNGVKVKQEAEQLALMQIGSIVKDITPRSVVMSNYIPVSLEEVADALNLYLNVKLYKGDNITDLRDRAVVAYNKRIHGVRLLPSPDKAFDYAMKGV